MEEHDSIKEVREFDFSKMSVQGLVDSGITTIPKIFQYEPKYLPLTSPSPLLQIPTIDLSGLLHSDQRPKIAHQICEAASTWGFFQIINHSIPLSVLTSTIAATKAFHELPQDTKNKHYGRNGLVAYNTNVDLFRSKAASWRDTLLVKMAPEAPKFEEIPEICREQLLSWDEHVEKLGDVLSELLCEGLGIKATRLKELKCLNFRGHTCHYYPHCPQVDLTMGFPSHTDKVVMTVLLRNQGGLQVKHGEDWVDVKPIPAALFVNIADTLQMISNDAYKSAEHRVLANPFEEPKISIATFIGPANTEDETECYGPLEELLSPENPPLYSKFRVSELFQKIAKNELAKLSFFDEFKL